MTRSRPLQSVIFRYKWVVTKPFYREAAQMSNEELVAVIQAGAEERMGELWEQVKGLVA